MFANTYIFSILIVLTSSALLVITGIQKRPGIGILATLAIIGLTLWLRGDKLSAIGLKLPETWGGAIWRGFIYSLAIYFISTVFIEPLSEVITKTAHDYSKFDGIRGSWVATIQILLVVWIFVAVIEESIYRGFLMTEISRIAGNTSAALYFNVLFTSIVFGLSHGYQNLSGVLSTGAIGALFACVFILSKFSLSEAILAHAFLDTIGVILIALKWDLVIREKVLTLIWKLPP